MKAVFKRIFILMITFAILVSCFAACDTNNSGNNGTETEDTSTDQPGSEEKVTYTLDLSADKATAQRGDTVTLTAVLKAEGQEDIPSEDTEFILVNGSEYATVADNILTVLNTAPDGAIITVQAKEGASYSNTVTIKISVPLNSIAISASTASVTAGQSVAITKVCDPTDATQPISWSIIEGADIAAMAGDVLMISAEAEIGAVIKLKAVSGDVESNELTFTVRSSVEDVKAESVTISAEVQNLFAGQSVIINSAVKPANTTDSVTLTITEGTDFANIVGNVLVVNGNATVGTVIKVKAVAGDVESNELVFTVRDNKVAVESITIYSNNLTPLKGQSVAISKQVEPANATEKVTWVFVEGDDKAEMIGDVLVISDNAVEGDVIKVKATAGELESNVLEFTVKSSEVKINKITLSADYFNLLAGQSMIIKSTFEPTDATEDVTLTITEGSDYADISGNVLVVRANAPAGAVIKVVAKSKSANSNELVFTVRGTSKPAEKVEISAENTTPIAGHSVVINYTITPEDTTDKLTWVITKGQDIASMSGNVLVVSASAEKGSEIKVKAVVGNVESEELTFTVRPAVEEIKVESIRITANTAVLAGQAVVINKIVNPTDANQPVLWQITEGVNYATINGDALMVSSNASTGAIIKVKAVAGDVESNELTFVVQPSKEEVNASKFYIDLSADSLRLDKKGSTAIPVLVAEVYNYNYQKVTDKELEFRLLSGSEYLTISAGESSCSFIDLKGHGTAVVEVRIKDTDIVATATIDVIVPPDAIVLPGAFAERNDIEYSFSMIDHTITGTNGNVVKVAGEAKLPFAPTVRGVGKVCQDLTFSFRHETGATGDDVAVYENGAITFKKTGKVTVTVSSASGSKIEAATSYTFNINEGYNVNTFEELWLVVRNDQYNGQQINLVVLEKPDGSANNYNYGYDLVPLVALKAKADQTIDEILRGPNEVPAMTNNRIQAVNKSLYINGNNHKIDVSQMRIFTMAEYDAYSKKYGVTDELYNVSSLLSAEPWNEGGDISAGTNNNKTYSVNLYNVETKGNQPIDYDPTLYRNEGSTEINVGCYTHGISIGAREYDCHYYIDANNLTSSGFGAGMNFTGVVGNGKVSNAYAYNCFSTGIFSRSNIMTFENLKFGACGATGLELAPEECDEAGLNDNEVQQVTFLGEIEASFLNDGYTTYFQNYTVQGATVPQIINGNVTMYNTNQVGHIRNADGQFIFVTLIFNNLTTLEPNSSIVHYPAYQKGGIVDITELPTNGSVNTTHQFIRMPIYVDLPGFGQVQAGTALFYNHYYVAD